jgi:hypothetical protein
MLDIKTKAIKEILIGIQYKDMNIHRLNDDEILVQMKCFFEIINLNDNNPSQIKLLDMGEKINRLLQLESDLIASYSKESIRLGSLVTNTCISEWTTDIDINDIIFIYFTCHGHL